MTQWLQVQQKRIGVKTPWRKVRNVSRMDEAGECLEDCIKNCHGWKFRIVRIQVLAEAESV